MFAIGSNCNSFTNTQFLARYFVGANPVLRFLSFLAGIKYAYLLPFYGRDLSTAQITMQENEC